MSDHTKGVLSLEYSKAKQEYLNNSENSGVAWGVHLYDRIKELEAELLKVDNTIQWSVDHFHMAQAVYDTFSITRQSIAPLIKEIGNE